MHTAINSYSSFQIHSAPLAIVITERSCLLPTAKIKWFGDTFTDALYLITKNCIVNLPIRAQK